VQKKYIYAIYETLNNNPSYEIPLIISDYLLDILNYLNGIIKIDSKHISKYVNKDKLIKVNDKISYKIFKIDLVED
jgi:hypothetical protein